MNFSIKNILFISSFVFFVQFNFALAIGGECSKKGYSVMTINGVLNSETDAKSNSESLKRFLPKVFNSEPLTIDYLYNESHIAGLGDILKAIKQGIFDKETVRDTDLLSMLTDASAKVKTQKLLLVAHSQGNFYANGFYDSVADKEGGLPAQAIGVYSVATPASRVAGGGKWLTSDTDKVIAGVVSRLSTKEIMAPNTHIELGDSDNYLGHGFTDTYLKYRANTIVSDIQTTLDKLHADPERREDAPCIDPPKLTLMDKAVALSLSFTDGAVDGIAKGIALDAKIVTKTVGATMAVGDFAGKQVFRAEVFAIRTAASAAVWTYNASVAAVEKTITVAQAITDSMSAKKGDTVANQGASLLGVATEEAPPQANPVVADQIIQRIPLEAVAVDQEAGQGDESNGHKVAHIETPESVATTAPVVQPVFAVAMGGGGSPTPVSIVASAGQVSAPADTVAPVVTIIGDDPKTVLVGDPYTDLGASALDDIDGVRTISSLSNVNIFTAGSYTVTYTTSDSTGNTATATRTVNVVHDESMLASSDLNNNAIPDSEESELVVSADTSLAAGEYSFNTLRVAASSTLTLMGTTTPSRTFKGVKIVARNVIVESGAAISANYQGHQTNGPGSPTVIQTGASYGGQGNWGGVATYGSATLPLDLGSGGGICCTSYTGGGGAIRLVIAETLLNAGVISADGGSSSSGGSIYITAHAVDGSGTIHANGGNYAVSAIYHGQGGGGRIAVYTETSSFSGTISALGGCGSMGMGYLYECAGHGTTGLFDMVSNDLYVRAPWRFQATDGPFNFNRIIIEDGATVSIEDGAQITANELVLSGASSLSISGNAVVTIPTISVNGQSSLTFSGSETLALDVLSITGTSTVSVAQGRPLVFSARNITISAGSLINVDGKGYAPAIGPGAPIEFYDGASHGGAGYNNSATSTYGSAFAPTEMGSGGNGHSSYAYGGGAVKIVASGTLMIDGTVSANGGQTASGGSIYLVADTITGSGSLSANGGGTYWQGQYIGPGGGGRIAIDSPRSSFSGGMSVSGMCYSSSGFIIGCSESGSVVYGASIGSFDLAGLSPATQGAINERVRTIGLIVSYGTDITALTPTITVSRGATVAPASGEAQDFTNPISYIVTSATSSTSTYVVTVTVAPAPDTTPPVITIDPYDGVTPTSTPLTVAATTNEGTLNAATHTFIENGSFDFVAADAAGNTATSTVTITNIDTTPPAIVSYTLNGNQDSVTLSSFATPLALALSANEDVDWVSVKIENEVNADNYKVFYSGTGCVDDTTSCEKSWNGTMSHGTLENGTYHIKVHMRDIAGNEFSGYLSPYVIIVAQEV